MKPRIKFENLGLQENIEIVKWAFYEDNGVLSVHDYTIDYFPLLASVSLDTDKKVVEELIKEVVTKDYKKYEKRIKEETKRYESIWQEYSDRYFEELVKYLGISCDRVIIAKVGLIPVFPRYLDDFTFCFCTGLDEKKVISTIAHESLHFLWFLKWKELYPDCKRREYDSPYLPWQYSEMVTDPILNNEPFKDILNIEERGYDSFYEIRDGEYLVMDKLRSIYAEDKNIEFKIKEGYEYIKRVLEMNNNLKYEYYYIESKNGKSNCVVRTCCKLFELDYDIVFDELCNLTKELNCESFNDVKVFETYLERHGFIKEEFKSDKIIKDIVLDKGEYVIFCYDKKEYYHMIPIIDNIIYDKSDECLDLYVISLYKRNG